jgi:hypothetical protein
MAARSGKGSGQRLDNRPAGNRPHVISIWPEGANPDVDPPALRVPGDSRVTVIGRVHRDRPTTFDFEAQRRADALRVLKANQSAEWLSRWGSTIDDAIAALDNGRGAPHSPERAKVFELLDEEVVEGRDPDDKRIARVIGNLVGKDPSQVRKWREEWKKERGHY